MNKNNSSLKIALPISSFLPGLGGMEVGLHNIACGLIAKGHEPVVISSFTYIRKLKRLKWSLPYRVVSFPPKIWLIFNHYPELGFFILDLFFKYLQIKFKFDVWHVTMGYPTGVAVTHFLENRNTPYLIQCVGEDIQTVPEINYGFRLDPKIDNLMKLYLPKCPMLIAITESVAKEYESIGINRKKIKMIPNGVSNKRFETSINKYLIKKKLGLDPDSFIFICVARNHPTKNITSLVNIAGKLKSKTKSKFQILLVGKNVSKLQDLVSESGLNDVVILKEEVGNNRKNISAVPEFPADDLIRYYQASNAFVFPTLTETFGIVIIEAMAAGLPVIVTDVPGCRDIVRNNRDGIVVPVKDDDRFVSAMNRLLEDEAMVEKYSNQSRQRALEFDWEDVVNKFCELYKELLI